MPSAELRVRQKCPSDTDFGERYSVKRPISNLILLILLLLIIIPIFAPAFSLALPQADSRKLSVARGDDRKIRQATRFYGLVIGNNEYLYINQLRTAVNDAEAVAGILQDKYNFRIKLLKNATRDQILTALNDLRRTLEENASLLIYYAGHGQYDPDVEKAYWLPVDAQQDNNVKWISADDVTTNVKGIAARHVLIVSDSCYSGMIPRESNAGLTPSERNRFMRKMIEGKSRILMSSGGKEPVDDGGEGGHSIFANAFLRGLSQIEEDVFTAGELFQSFIQEPVAGKSDQTPQFNPLRNSGHESGDFVFMREIIPVMGEPSKPASTIETTRINEKANVVSSHLSAETIREVQNLLMDQGYYEGQVNGVLTKRLQDALLTYQREHNLPQTGELDILTLDTLKLNAPSVKPPVNPIRTDIQRANTVQPASPVNKSVVEKLQQQTNELISNCEQAIKKEGKQVDRARPSQPEIEILLALDRFASILRTYSVQVSSIKDVGDSREATLIMAKEARKTDKIIVTSTSSIAPNILPKWDGIRQLVIQLMLSQSIRTSEIEN